MDFPFIPFAVLIAILFLAYFLARANGLSKKLPGWEKVNEKRGWREEQTKL